MKEEIKIEIKTERNLYKDNYYRIEINCRKKLNDKQFDKIQGAINDITEIIDPMIDEEKKNKITPPQEEK